MEPIIHIRDLWRTFVMGHALVHALAGVTLSVDKGEFVAVMGPSGSGKSTLLNLIGGLDRPTAGEVIVAGIPLAELDENRLAAYRRQRVGFVFQSFNLIATMTALQNVEFPMVFARLPRAQRQARARQLLAAVGLADRMAHKPTELSGGEQQRVAIARALANRPDILLADEPTGNLDSRTGAEVMELLARANREAGCTILVATHDPAVAAFANRVVRLRDGRVSE